jgi:multidrug efflux pump subunit AcrA (membrane-fusion protein)
MKNFLTAFATAVIVAAAVWTYRDTSRPAPVAAPAPVRVPVVQLPAPVKTSSENGGEFEGRLEAGSEVEIRTALTGYPVRLRAETGDFVQKGQLLVELGDAKLEESVKQAEAALNVVKAEFQARDARLAQTDKESPSLIPPAGARPASLARHEGVGPQKHVPSPEEELDRSRLQQAEAGVERAKLALAETRIVAPIAGFVVQRQANGELSKPDALLMRIVDITTVKTVVQVSPEMYSRIVSDQEAHVTINEMPGRTFLGKVAHKASVRNLRARDTTVAIEVANPESLLKPGMYARARVMFDQNNEPRLASLPAWFGKGARGPDGKMVGPQTDAELLANLKGLTQTMSTMASDLERREHVAKETAEASREHFLALEKLIDRLREESGSSRRSSFEKTADAIDNLPALHVDEELLAFSTEISKGLREMAERRRAIARETTSVDWTYWDRTQRASSAVKSLGMQRINSGMADMRRKLTRKYNLEFLATAERTPASSHRDTRRARR